MIRQGRGLRATGDGKPCRSFGREHPGGSALRGCRERKLGLLFSTRAG